MQEVIDMSDKLTPEQVRELLDPNQWFGVTFTKRTTGEDRVMTARLGVRKHLKGGERAYDFSAKGLLGVWEKDAVGARGPKDTGYRTVPIENLTEIRAKGMIHTMKDGVLVESRPRD